MKLKEVSKIYSLLHQAMNEFYNDDDQLKYSLNDNTRELLSSISVAIANSQAVYDDIRKNMGKL